MIEEWDGDGAIRIPDESLQELELDVGDAVYLIEEFVGDSSAERLEHDTTHYSPPTPPLQNKSTVS